MHVMHDRTGLQSLCTIEQCLRSRQLLSSGSGNDSSHGPKGFIEKCIGAYLRSCCFSWPHPGGAAGDLDVASRPSVQHFDHDLLYPATLLQPAGHQRVVVRCDQRRTSIWYVAILCKKVVMDLASHYFGRSQRASSIAPEVRTNHQRSHPSHTAV